MYRVYSFVEYEKFNYVLNIDQCNTVDDQVLTSCILSNEETIMEVVKARELEKSSDSDSE